MNHISILFCLFCFIYSKETASSNCSYLSTFTEDKLTFDNCQKIAVSEGEKCCVGVISNMGKNQYFCESFNETATQEEIEKKIDTDILQKSRE